MQTLPDPVAKLLAQHPELAVVPHEVQLTSRNYSLEQLMRAVIPEVCLCYCVFSPSFS